MSRRLLVLLCAALSVASCDKAKKLVQRAGNAMQGSSKAAGSGVDRAADVDLQKLVDQTPDGVIFRKDLPFPARLSVTSSRRLEIAGRWVQTSELGKDTRRFEGTETLKTRFERTGDELRMTLLEYGIIAAADKKKEAGEKPTAPAGPVPKPTIFDHTASGWVARNSADFQSSMNWKSLEPHLDQVLTDQGVTSRPMWFAKHRFKIGEQLIVPGDSLAMLIAGKATGSLSLTLESIAAVHGHPCGVFTVKGNYSRKQFPDLKGQLNDEEVSIGSGKIWVSLLYPIVLREELNTIQTLRSGSKGGLVERGQGSVGISVIREWKKSG